MATKKSEQEVRVVKLFHESRPDRIRVTDDFDAAYELVKDYFDDRSTTTVYKMTGGGYKLSDSQNEAKTASIWTKRVHTHQ